MIAAVMELPTNRTGLIGLVIFVVAPILGGLIHLRMQQSITSKQVNEVHEQTVNDHQTKTNLRDDIDRALAIVDEVRTIVRDVQDRGVDQQRDIRGIRADLGGIRTDITAVSRELHDERERSIKADESLWRAIQRKSKGDGDAR